MSGKNMERTDRKSNVPPIGRARKGQKDPYTMTPLIRAASAMGPRMIARTRGTSG